VACRVLLQYLKDHPGDKLVFSSFQFLTSYLGTNKDCNKLVESLLHQLQLESNNMKGNPAAFDLKVGETETYIPPKASQTQFDPMRPPPQGLYTWAEVNGCSASEGNDNLPPQAPQQQNAFAVPKGQHSSNSPAVSTGTSNASPSNASTNTPPFLHHQSSSQTSYSNSMSPPPSHVVNPTPPGDFGNVGAELNDSSLFDNFLADSGDSPMVDLTFNDGSSNRTPPDLESQQGSIYTIPSVGPTPPSISQPTPPSFMVEEMDYTKQLFDVNLDKEMEAEFQQLISGMPLNV